MFDISEQMDNFIVSMMHAVTRSHLTHNLISFVCISNKANVFFSRKPFRVKYKPTNRFSEYRVEVAVNGWY